MADYSEDVAFATEEIQEFGRPITIQRRGAKTGSASDPEPGALTDHAGDALFLEYKEGQIDGTSVIRGDVMAWTTVLDITPQAGDILTDGDKRYTIIDPGTLKPGSTEILHMMQVREIGADSP